MATAGNVTRVNREVLRRINREVSMRAARFANAILSGVFRAIFRVEKAYEAAEPEVYQLEYETDRILWARLDAWHMNNMAVAIANEDVLASRYHLFTEYDFVIIADISQSMMLNWWPVYGERLDEDMSKRPLPKWRVPGDQTKLFFLKYTLCSFLHAARINDFISQVLLVGGGKIQQRDSRTEPNLEEILLVDIDRHCRAMAEMRGPEPTRLQDALRRVAARRRRAIVLCISDFTDALRYPTEAEPRVPLREILLPLAEISAEHQVLVLHIMDRLEIAPQIELIKLMAKDCPYTNPECHPQQKPLGNVSPESLVEFRQRAETFCLDLHNGLAQFGVKYEQIVSGRDDEQVDKRIYQLGEATGA